MIIQELITLLKYQVDQSGLTSFISKGREVAAGLQDQVDKAIKPSRKAINDAKKAIDDALTPTKQALQSPLRQARQAAVAQARAARAAAAQALYHATPAGVNPQVVSPSPLRQARQAAVAQARAARLTAALRQKYPSNGGGFHVPAPAPAPAPARQPVAVPTPASLPTPNPGAWARVRSIIQTTGQNVRSVGSAIKTGWVQGVQQGIAAHRSLNSVQQQTKKGAQQISNEYSGMGGLIRNLLAGFSIISTARIADVWAGIEARVGLATNGIQEQNRAMKELYATAQSTGQEFEATSGLFTAIQRNNKELEIGLDQSLALTDQIGKMMTIGGGSSASQSAALTQLGQALGSGVLRGDELNSILEQAPRLAQGIADAFGVSVGKLRELGKAGKLTSKDLVAGLLKNSAKVNAEFEKMPKTFGRGMTLMMNAYGRFVNDLNKGTRASEMFYAVSKLIADNMEKIASIGAFGALAFALTKLKPLAVGTLAPFLRMLAILTSLYLIGEDIFTWSRGGASVFGDLFGEKAQWQPTIDSITLFFTNLKNWLGDSNLGIQAFLMKWGTIGIIGYTILRILGGIMRGFGLLLGPLGWIVRGIALIGTGLAALVGWPAILAAAFAAAIVGLVTLIYNNFDTIKTFVNGVWDSVVQHFKDIWTEAINDIVNLGKKLGFDRPEVAAAQQAQLAARQAERGITPAGVDSAAAMQNEGGGAYYGAGRRRAPRGDTTVTNNVTINAKTDDPRGLANLAGEAAGQGTVRATSRPDVNMPNVEAAP